MEDARAAWENGLSDEVHFWDGIILGTDPRKEWVDDFVARMKGESEFPEHLAYFFEKLKLEDVKIIDVGAGPHTVLGPNFRGRRLAITAVDPLADHYNKLISRTNLEPAIPTVMGEAETLSDLFGEEFDLVYSRNALDHSYNAPKAIEQMLRICKPGGYVFFEGASNEAVKQQFTGLHQWNFMPVDGDLVVWKINFHISMRTYLTNYQSFSAVGTEWFQVTIRKNDRAISN